MTEPLNAAVDLYQHASTSSPPPPIGSDALTAGGTPFEELLRALGLAANAGDPDDETATAAEHSERDAATAGAAEAFDGQDEQGAQVLGGLQQVPQLLAGVAGTAMQSIGQLPAQLGQAVQQAAQIGLGLTTGLAGSTAGSGAFDGAINEVGDALDADVDDGTIDGGDPAWLDESGFGTEDPTGSPVPAPAATLGPAAALAPAALPVAGPVPSAATSPASAAVPPSPPPAAPHPGPGPGMAGAPMMPVTPGALSADRGATGTAPEAKRVAVPPVRNGAPVQGRLITPAAITRNPDAPRNDGRPVATRVVTGSP